MGSEPLHYPHAGGLPLDAKVTDLALSFFSAEPGNIQQSGFFSLADSNLNFQYPGLSAFTGKFDFSGP